MLSTRCICWNFEMLTLAFLPRLNRSDWGHTELRQTEQLMIPISLFEAWSQTIGTASLDLESGPQSKKLVPPYEKWFSVKTVSDSGELPPHLQSHFSHFWCRCHYTSAQKCSESWELQAFVNCEFSVWKALKCSLIFEEHFGRSEEHTSERQ